VLIRANGVPTYFAADIAYHKDKFDRGFDKVIDIWGADHHGHVARMKRAISFFGYDPQQLTVILMQLVKLYQGGELIRMSKRSGQYVTLKDLIEEVGYDAARYFFVMRNPDSAMDFDLDLAKSKSADNPVFYVQYAHARICSILRQTQAKGYALPDFKTVDYSVLGEVQEGALMKKLADLPEEIATAAETLEPHRLCAYLHDLASSFHSFYNHCRVNTEEELLRNARLGLSRATAIAIENVLTILGVNAPTEM
jgi:arginyl-tRNA synthetase